MRVQSGLHADIRCTRNKRQPPSGPAQGDACPGRMYADGAEPLWQAMKVQLVAPMLEWQAHWPLQAAISASRFRQKMP